jgi:hypothetical protein
MLMNPGATAMPAASISTPARASASVRIAAMRSPLMPTSATAGSPPLPS